MFQAEIKINGVLVSLITGSNLGKTLKDAERCLYEYKIYQPETNKVRRGVVNHRRGDGIEILIAKILSHDWELRPKKKK